MDNLRVETDAAPRGALYISMQGAVNYLTYFLSYVFLARIVTPIEIGKLPLLNAALAVYNTVTMLALQNATVRFVSEYAGKGRLDKAAGAGWVSIRLVAAVSIPVFILLAFLSPQVSGLIYGSGADTGLVVFMLLAGLISNFTVLLASVLWGLRLFRKMVTCNVTSVVAGRAIGLLFAFVGLGLPGFVAGWSVGYALVLALSIVYVRPYVQNRLEAVPPKQMLAYSYPILFTALTALVLNWADVTVLYALTGSLVSTGVYYLGLAGAQVISIITTALASAVFPTLSALYGRGQTESFREVLGACQRVLNVAVMPAGFALAAIASTAVTVAYGKTYLAATVPFAILTVSAVLPAYLTLMAITLQAIGRTQPLIKIWGAAALTEVGVTAALVASMNVVGSALGRVSMSVVAVLVAYFCVKGTWWPGTDRTSLAKGIALSVLVAIVLFVFDSLAANAFRVTPLARILLDGGVLLLVYAGGVITLKPLIPRDIEILMVALPSSLHGLLRLIRDWAVAPANAG